MIVVQGIMDLLLSDSKEAEDLRAAYVSRRGATASESPPHPFVKRTCCCCAGDGQIVPMLNPDGVFLGNYRTSGDDLNRHAAVHVRPTGGVVVHLNAPGVS